MRLKFQLLSILAIALALATTPARAVPHILVDLSSGRVLSSKEPFDPWHPASLTKMMTAYVAFRALKAGEITPLSPVRISSNAAKQQPSKMGYPAGTVLNVKNALAMVIVKSANDISVALAESLAGSVQGFARRMNAEARRLGMKDTNFVNPHGLHDQRQVTTARDLALLVGAIHREFPEYALLFAVPAIKTDTKVHHSYNLLLERFRGADGMKTGFVCASGYNFAGTATRAGRRLAAIVLGQNSQTDRAVAAALLLTEGFQQPLDHGIPLSDLKPEAEPAKTPRNLRARMCSKEARAKRYEPAAGEAVISSPWLQAREVTVPPLQVSTGGATGPEPLLPDPQLIELSNIPLPKFRPPLEPVDDLLLLRTTAANAPVPTPRPVLN